MAYHVDQLVEVGFLKVVRTRKVRAIEERLYGRVGRVIIIGEGAMPAGTRTRSFLTEAHNEAVPGDDAQMPGHGRREIPARQRNVRPGVRAQRQCPGALRPGRHRGSAVR